MDNTKYDFTSIKDSFEDMKLRETLYIKRYELNNIEDIIDTLNEIKLYNQLTHNVDIALITLIKDKYQILADSDYMRMDNDFDIINTKLKNFMDSDKIELLKFYVYICKYIHNHLIHYTKNIDYNIINIENVFLFVLKKSRYINGLISYDKAPFGKITNKLILSGSISNFKIKKYILDNINQSYERLHERNYLEEYIKVNINTINEPFEVDDVEIIELLFRNSDIYDFFFNGININQNFDYSIIKTIYIETKNNFVYNKEFLSLCITEKYLKNIKNKQETLFIIYMMYITRFFINDIIKLWKFKNEKLLHIFNEYSIQNMFFTVTHYHDYMYFLKNINKAPFSDYFIKLFSLDLFSRPTRISIKSNEIVSYNKTKKDKKQIETLAYDIYEKTYTENNISFNTYLTNMLDDEIYITKLSKKSKEDLTFLEKYILLEKKLKKYIENGDKYYIEPPIDFRIKRMCIPGDRTKNLSFIDKIMGELVTMTYAVGKDINLDEYSNRFIEIYESLDNETKFNKIYNDANNCYLSSSSMDSIKYINKI